MTPKQAWAILESSRALAAELDAADRERRVGRELAERMVAIARGLVAFDKIEVAGRLQ
jgi:hypothetical protein